jgi:polysaccharide pyruvyl transferase WcaK-like protein
MASKLGITRVGAIGVSLGPYKTLEDEKFVHKSLKSLEFLALRDNESYQEARSLQLPYKPIQASDLAMLLPKMKSESDFPVPTNPIIGISLCHYERFTNIPVKKEQERENNLLQGLKIFLNDKFRGTIRFLIFNDHGHYGDMEITQYFMNCLKSTNHKIEFFGYSNDPIFMWKKVAECSAFVSTRLHGCIFASAAKVPCISIEYHKKCSNFLDDINIEKKWRIGDMECSPKEFAVNLENLLLCDRKLFYPKRSHLMSLAEQNFLGPLDLKSH